MRALTEYKHRLLEQNVTIFVRRGGPNYQEGLRIMREIGQSQLCVHAISVDYSPCVLVTTGSKQGLSIHVFGPETHMTAIVGMALGCRPIQQQPKSDSHTVPILGFPKASSVGSFQLCTVHVLASCLVLVQSFMIPPSPGTSATNLSDMAEPPTACTKHILISPWDEDQECSLTPSLPLFTTNTRAIIWGMQPRAVQVCML